jgi:hypothetical protein
MFSNKINFLHEDDQWSARFLSLQEDFYKKELRGSIVYFFILLKNMSPNSAFYADYEYDICL